MMDEKWAVLIYAGVPDVDMSAAPAFAGTPTLTVGHDEPVGDVAEPVTYGPVALRTSEGEVTMVTMRERRAPYGIQMLGNNLEQTVHRRMRLLHFEIDAGELRLDGLETAPGGAVHLALWIVTPYTEEEAHDN